MTTSSAYAAAGQVSAITHRQGSSALAQLEYTYDPAGNRLTAHAHLPDGTRALTSTYDPLRRLTGAVATPGPTAAYGYDAVGNRTRVTVDGRTTTTYTAANQVLGWQYAA